MACHALSSATRSEASASAPYRNRVISAGLASRRWMSPSEAGRRLPIIPIVCCWFYPRSLLDGGGAAPRKSRGSCRGSSLSAVRLVLAFGLILAGLAVLVLLIPAAPMTGDGQYYIQFVRNGLQHGASILHERRLLGPRLIRALPLD